MPAGRSHIRRLLWLALMLLLAAGLGCGKSSSMPKTYPASGSVKFKDGKPASGGAIQLYPVGDTTFTVTGDIKDDGSFTLFTVKGSDRVAGAPEGEYRVTVMLPLPASQKASPAITLPKTYRIEARDNTLAFEIAPPK